MITTRKLMTAAFAAASVATLSLGAGGEAQARGGHGGGHSGGGGMHAGFSSKFAGGHGLRAHGNRFHFHRFHRFHRFGYAYNSCWKWTPDGFVNFCRALPY
jgi:hypothetical protein